LGSVKFNDDKILDKADNKTSANELVGKFSSRRIIERYVARYGGI